MTWRAQLSRGATVRLFNGELERTERTSSSSNDAFNMRFTRLFSSRGPTKYLCVVAVGGRDHSRVYDPRFRAVVVGAPDSTMLLLSQLAIPAAPAQP